MLVELPKVEQRYDAVRQVVGQGHTVAAVARHLGVSRQSVHNWLKRYEEAGLQGLIDRPRAPRSSPNQISPRIEAAVVNLRRWRPDWGERRIRHELWQRGIQPLPSRATIYRALVRNNLVAPTPRGKAKGDHIRFERSKPMQLWQIDLVAVPLQGDRSAFVIDGLDDHSRFCVLAKVLERPTSQSVCEAFGQALVHHGTPEEVLTDNGRQFTDRFAPHRGETLFDRICRHHGIDHILTGVRSPRTIGKIERFHRTLKAELARLGPFEDIDALQASIDEVVADYNHHRPHQSLGMATPAARFVAGPPVSSDSEVMPVTAGPSSSDATLLKRRVSPTGYFALAGQKFYLGRAHAGCVVTLRMGARLIDVLIDGQQIRTFPKPKREVKARDARFPNVSNMS